MFSLQYDTGRTPIGSDHTAFPLCIELNWILSFGLLVSPVVSHHSNTHSREWHWTPDAPASTFQVVKLQVWCTILGSCLSDFDDQYRN